MEKESKKLGIYILSSAVVIAVAILSGAFVIATGKDNLRKWNISGDEKAITGAPTVMVSEDMLSGKIDVAPLNNSQVEDFIKVYFSSEISKNSQKTPYRQETYLPVSIKVDQNQKKVFYNYIRVIEDKGTLMRASINGEASYNFNPRPKINASMSEQEKEKIRRDIFNNPLGIVFNNRIEKTVN